MSALSEKLFDPLEWIGGAYPTAVPVVANASLHGVHGPMDAYKAHVIRTDTEAQILKGKGVPVDLFVLSAGEPKQRDCTKIGGLPYWSRRREWPVDHVGSRLPFLAQFNLSKSTDLVGDLTASVLLLFSHPDPSAGCTVHLQSPIEGDELVSWSDTRDEFQFPAMYGTRWRTESFPEWRLKSDCTAEMLRLSTGAYVYDLGFAYELLGMLIGRCAFKTSTSKCRVYDGDLVCSFSGVSLHACEPREYPLLNLQGPLSEEEADRWLIPLSRLRDDSGMGVLYVIQQPNGDLVCVHDEL